MNVRDELSVADPLTLDEPREPNKTGPARGLMPTPVRASAARRRKLHAGHFAFMRAVVQGIDGRSSWDRYLRTEGEASDQRLVRSTIAWIRDEFAAAAQREDRHGTARLVRIDVATIADPRSTCPAWRSSPSVVAWRTSRRPSRTPPTRPSTARRRRGRRAAPD